MEKRNARVPPRRSVLDRLLDGGNLEAGRSVQRIGQEIRESVRRDLDLLLNTRPTCQSWPADLGEMPKSLLSFGLPELQTRSLATAGQWEDFRMEIEATIRQFEPRLRDVSVELIENAAEHDRTLRFTINAVLMMEGDSEQVIYETSLDPASRRLLVSPPTL